MSQFQSKTNKEQKRISEKHTHAFTLANSAPLVRFCELFINPLPSKADFPYWLPLMFIILFFAQMMLFHHRNAMLLKIRFLDLV